MEDHAQEHSDYAQEISSHSDIPASPVSDAETPSLSLSDAMLEGEYERGKADLPSRFIGREKPFPDQRNERQKKGHLSVWLFIVSLLILISTVSAAFFAYATWRHDSLPGTLVQPTEGTLSSSTQSLPAGLSPTATSISINSATSVPSPVSTSVPGVGVQPSSTNPPVQPVPTSRPTPTSPPTILTWNFDGGTQGWNTSEGAYKLATVSDASSPVYAGSGSLQVTTTLTGTGNSAYNGDSVYTHTEATNYFTASNLSNATATCYAYLPAGLAPGGTVPGYVQLFVKDTHYRNNFGGGINLSSSTTGTWVKLSFALRSGDADAGFDATQLSAIGVRIILNDGSTLNYTGPFYLDSCSIVG